MMTNEQIVAYVRSKYSGLFTERLVALLAEPYSTFQQHVRRSFEREAQAVPGEAMSPDDDWALGQNEVDLRNEARRARMVPSVFVCHDPEQAWIDDQAENAAHEREDTASQEGSP